MDIHQVLQEIGLPEREVSVYLALLELGESTVSPLAKKAGLKRTYVYDILESLGKKQLASFVEKRGRRHYSAEDPKKIEQLLKNRLARLSEVLPDIRSIYNNAVNKPKVRFYEGKDSVRQLFAGVGQVKEFSSLGSPDHIYRMLGKERIEAIARQVVKKRIRARELFTHSKVPVGFRTLYQAPLQQVRLLPPGTLVATDMFLLENRVILISYKGDVHAVVIEGSQIVATLQTMFDLLWRNAS